MTISYICSCIYIYICVCVCVCVVRLSEFNDVLPHLRWLTVIIMNSCYDFRYVLCLEWTFDKSPLNITWGWSITSHGYKHLKFVIKYKQWFSSSQSVVCWRRQQVLYVTVFDNSDVQVPCYENACFMKRKYEIGICMLILLLLNSVFARAGHTHIYIALSSSQVVIYFYIVFKYSHFT